MKPIKGTPAKELKQEIKVIEQEIGAVELNTKGLRVTDLRLELMVLDYQRSVLKDVSPQYSSQGLEYLLKDEGCQELFWWICDPKDPDSYRKVTIVDLMEGGQPSLFKLN